MAGIKQQHYASLFTKKILTTVKIIWRKKAKENIGG